MIPDNINTIVVVTSFILPLPPLRPHRSIKRKRNKKVDFIEMKANKKKA